MANIPFILTGNILSVLVPGYRRTIQTDHPNFRGVIDALKAGNLERVQELLEPAQVIQRVIRKARIENGEVLIGNSPVPTAITSKILRMAGLGLPTDPILRCLEKIDQNPRDNIRDEIFLFIEANGFMIHEDGDIIAYRSVRKDWRDLYTGQVDNSVGSKPYMDPSLVDPNRENTCSRGFHFAAYDYARNSYGVGERGDRLIVVKINPAHILAIPIDYNNQKGRCYTYEVMAELYDRQTLPEQEIYSNFETPVIAPQEWNVEMRERVVEILEDMTNLVVHFEDEITDIIRDKATLAAFQRRIEEEFGGFDEPVEEGMEVQELAEMILHFLLNLFHEAEMEVLREEQDG